MSFEHYIQTDFLSNQDSYDYFRYAQQLPVRFGEYDDAARKPTGLSANLSYPKALDVASRKYFPLEGYELIRSYLNVFQPTEVPRWHQDIDDIDGWDGYTVLYYSSLRWDWNDGGCTEFWLGDRIHGAIPIPNSAICFDSKVWHRATPFAEHIRYTYALKYEKYANEEIRKLTQVNYYPINGN